MQNTLPILLLHDDKMLRSQKGREKKILWKAVLENPHEYQKKLDEIFFNDVIMRKL